MNTTNTTQPTWQEIALQLEGELDNAYLDIVGRVDGDDMKVVYPIDDNYTAIFFEFEGNYYYEVVTNGGDNIVSGKLFSVAHAHELIENDFTE
jgi:hypothetical protein